MPLFLLLGGAGIGLLGLGYFTKETSQAVDATSNATIKFALAAGAAYLIAKKAKLI
jgi:hypothetical protein